MQGLLADNAGPSLVPAEIAAAWAREYAYPELVPATNREFFERAREAARRRARDVPRRLGGLVGRRARLGRARGRLQPPRPGRGPVGADAARHGGRADRRRADPTAARSTRCTGAWRSSTSTHGARPIPAASALTGRESGELQWQAKAALAVEALRPRRGAARRRGARFRAGRGDSILVLNPSGHARSDVVEVFLPAEPRRSRASRSPWSTSSASERVPTRSGRPSRAATGRRGGCCRSSPATCRASATGASSSSRTAPDGLEGEAGALENEHYRVELDVDGGHAVSLLDRELGLDLVDAESAFGFGQVVRDLYGGPLQATRRASRGGAGHAMRRDAGRPR